MGNHRFLEVRKKTGDGDEVVVYEIRRKLRVSPRKVDGGVVEGPPRDEFLERLLEGERRRREERKAKSAKNRAKYGPVPAEYSCSSDYYNEFSASSESEEEEEEEEGSEDLEEGAESQEEAE